MKTLTLARRLQWGILERSNCSKLKCSTKYGNAAQESVQLSKCCSSTPKGKNHNEIINAYNIQFDSYYRAARCLKNGCEQPRLTLNYAFNFSAFHIGREICHKFTKTVKLSSRLILAPETANDCITI